MNNDQLNSLLDSIYELEGLVHLAIAREDIPDSLPTLIARKGEELAARAGSLRPTLQELQEPSGPTENQVLPRDIDDSTIPVEVQNPCRIIEDSTISTDETEAGDVADTEYMSDSGYMPNLEDMPANTVKTPDKDSKTRGRLVFSINDRFRFKRELFGNSDADFNNTLALVASMEDYEEAEDYFAGELQWDKSRVEVADFLEILKKYFQ